MNNLLKKVTAGAVGFSMLTTSFVSLLTPLSATAQSANPLSLPLFNGSTVTYKGSWTYDWPDGAGGDLSYGGSAIGVSEDGQYMYIACNVVNAQMGIAKLKIPAIGGRATVVQPCQGPTSADFSKILPLRDGGKPLIGGVLEQNGRMTVTGYWSYDANGAALASHWSGSSLTNLSGPYLGAWKSGSPAANLGIKTSGFVKDHITPIPVEWRSTLGGTALSTAGYTSIISRASYGASVSVFDPSTVTANGFQLDMLLGCPNQIASCVTYGTPTSNNYNGSELSGGAFIVPGTRTLVAIEREASGPTCYGYTTTNPALHNTPYPGPGYDAQNVVWCYSLSDPLDQKGPKGYPYRLVAKFYDLAELVAVKNGTKNPWDIRQYSTFDMPASSAGESISSGAYNPVTNEYYLSRYTGGGVNTIFVYGGFGSGGASSGGGTTDTTAPTVSMSAPANGSTVSGSSVSVSANASDNVSVAGVQFKLDGANLGAEDTASPYSTTWNTTTATNGTHTLTAVARDSSGNTATASSISVTVNNNTITVQSPTADIKANSSDGPISVPASSGVTLTWTSTNATSCSVNPGGYSGLSGTQTTAAIESGRTFTLSCTGAGGTKTDSVVVNPSSTTVTDTTKPTVNITAPTSYTAIKGVPILVTADATDNVGVVGVQFKLDGVNLNTEDLTSAYSTLWDTTNATDGAHTLTAVARDAAGNTQTSASVTVTISSPTVVDTTAPTASITSPANNSEVNKSVTLSADATDNVGVVGVQFKLNGSNLNSEDNTAPYSTTWNTDTVTNGSYTVTAVARDAAGNTTTSSGIVLRVYNDINTVIVPPVVDITSPADGSTLSGSVTVSANASDDKGVVGVQFKLDGVNLQPEDTTAPYSITWNTVTSTNGMHTLTATARDVEGNQKVSVSRSVGVNNASPVPPPPTLGINIGDSVKTTAWVNVRSTAGGRYLGTQRTGKTGIVIAGPATANNLTWWKVNFTSGADGWVAADYLAKNTVAMTVDDYRKNIANIYLIIKYLQERLAGQN